MTTTSLSITVNYGGGDINGFIKSSTDPRGECLALKSLFGRLADGATNGKLWVSKASVAAVRASGTYTIVYADLKANDTVVIGGITITCVTGTPSGFTQFQKGGNLAAAVANLAAAINGLTTLNIYVSAAVTATGVVTVTAHESGVLGNLITTTATVTTTGALVAGAAALAGGLGGAVVAPVVYSRGI